MDLHPWAVGPFELLVHAEEHFRGGDDFDRRMALILFDDVVEVAISTYLSLHPIQRGDRTYAKTDVEMWLNNFHSKLDFFEIALTERQLDWVVAKSHIVWCHDQRNEQYHGGRKGTPEWSVLQMTRTCAFWVVSILFELPGCYELVSLRIEERQSGTTERDPRFDRAIDAVLGMVEIGQGTYYASELLFSADHSAYLQLGSEFSEAGFAEDGSEA